MTSVEELARLKMPVTSESQLAPFDKRSTAASYIMLKRRVADVLESPLDYLALHLGLFTVGWDTVANMPIGPFNLKVSHVLFLVALFLSLFRRENRYLSSGAHSVTRVAAMIVLVMVFSSYLAVDSYAGLGQVARALIGAIVPFVAVGRMIQTPGDLRRALTWLVRGVLFCTLFGFYQLAAFYTGLPQIVEYTGVSGGLGRIAAFSYEPAVFGQLVLFGIAAVLTRIARFGDQPSDRFALLLLSGGLLATNSRALFLSVPLFLLLARPWRVSSTLKQFWVGALSAVAIAITFVSIVRPTVLEFVRGQFASIFDPNEVSSNARRLSQYRFVIELIDSSGWFGIGPGNLYLYAAGEGALGFDGGSSTDVIANNVWLQALLDGGPLLLLLEALLVLIVIRHLCRSRRNSALRVLCSAWIAVMLISGFLGSGFFATARWVLLGVLFSPSVQEENNSVRALVVDGDVRGHEYTSSTRVGES